MPEPRRAAAGFVTGLLSDLEVKTCWQVAEQAGHARPDAMQRLLYRARWDADAVRDDGGDHSLLIRRNTCTGELASYRCWSPHPASLNQLVRVAGIRWSVEEGLQAAEVRSASTSTRSAAGTPDTAAPHPSL